MADVERMYINGEWVLAQSGATFDVVNPADRSVVARVTNGAVPEVERAVTAAHAAFREWSLLAPKDRGRVLLKIQELMEERRDDLARLVTLENGKPFDEAKKEVQFSLGYFGWFAEEARRMPSSGAPGSSQAVTTSTVSRTRRDSSTRLPWSSTSPTTWRSPRRRSSGRPPRSSRSTRRRR